MLRVQWKVKNTEIRAGQLFVDNFGRLNMTVQTGSEVAVAGTWTQGLVGLLNEGTLGGRNGGMIAHQMRLFKSTKCYQWLHIQVVHI